MKDKPIYIKIDKYKETLDILDVVKSKIAKARTTVEKIRQLKDQENAELDLWSKNLDEVSRKTEHITQLLFERSD